MTMRLYDTRAGAIVDFAPEPLVRMYVCGITPYDSTHLGHAFTYLTYDLVIRRLESLGHEVQMVRNVTDVDDSILPKARSLGVDFLELAAAEMARFHSDMDVLDTRPPIAEPRATESIEPMLDLLTRLDAGGHVYTVEGTTYFDVSTYPAFGALSGYDTDQMVEFARERGGHPDDPRQRNPLDFVLWQPSASDEPVWDSPWGPGRPGWHIECSAMSWAQFGATLDLHGGGDDLVFPHHECELAQSEAGYGQPFVRHWMHVGMVAYQGVKMSKSLGNLVFVSDLAKRADPRAIRLALLRHHYRAGFEWFDDEIDGASADLARWHEAARSDRGPDPAPYLERVAAAIDNDVDTPTAASVLDELADAISGWTGPADATGAAGAGLGAGAKMCGLDLGAPLS